MLGKCLGCLLACTSMHYYLLLLLTNQAPKKQKLLLSLGETGPKGENSESKSILRLLVGPS